ncbi:hypothetical protein EC968_007346 [Mortierella alpina]|nr:hypothetical protein EC968_007346 [Mortierella alpina]
MSNAQTVSIFDLPPVVDVICSYLRRQDYFNASLVNRTFHHGCQRYIWKKVVFSHIDDEEAISREHRRTLRANSHWIQHLKVNKIHTPLTCLTKTPNACRNLKVLDCSLQHKSSEYTKSLAKFLDLNSHIKMLRIEFSDDSLQPQGEDSQPSMEGIKQVAVNLWLLQSLRFISVDTAGCFGPVDLYIFLSCLPPSVEGFKFSQLYPKDNGVQEGFYTPSLPSLAWREVYPNLIDLEFGEFEHYDLTSLVIPLLRRCPRLVRLTLPIIPGSDLPSVAEALRGNCPELKFLTIVGHLQEDNLLPMVDAIPALTSLDLPVNVPTTAVFVPHMIAKWSNTLTSMTLGAGAILNSSDIQLLLTSCPRLQFLWMTPVGGTYNARAVTDHYSPLNLSDLVQSEWACLGLLGLCIVFHDERVEQDTLEQHLEQEERTREWIKKAYAQLGKLENLEVLQLGWGHPFGEEVDGDGVITHQAGPLVHMDFSLASGLALLKGLSSLSELSLDGMARISVGAEELEWIQQTWPSARISGLNSTGSMGRDSA